MKEFPVGFNLRIGGVDSIVMAEKELAKFFELLEERLDEAKDFA